MVLVYNLKFLSRGELAFTHNGTHFVEPSKFNDQFQECPKRYLSFGFKTLECRFRDARYFRKAAPAQAFIKISKLYSIIYYAESKICLSIA